MRFLAAAALLPLAVSLALPIPPTDTFALAAAQTTESPAPRHLELLKYCMSSTITLQARQSQLADIPLAHEQASAEFSIHCEGCALESQADESLVCWST